MMDEKIINMQLVQFAKYYLDLADKLSCDDKDLDTKIEDLTYDYVKNHDSPIYIYMAHMASSAIRLSILAEDETGNTCISAYDPKKWRKRDVATLRKNLQKCMPTLVRDMIVHGVDTDKSKKARDQVLHELTPREWYNHLLAATNDIESTLRQNNLLI
jgi:hypothetical protein